MLRASVTTDEPSGTYVSRHITDDAHPNQQGFPTMNVPLTDNQSYECNTVSAVIHHVY